MGLKPVIKKFQDLSVEELYAIMQIRQVVFIVEQNCPYLDADGKDPFSQHIMCYFENRLVAYCRIVHPGVSYDEVSIGRVVTSPEYRRHNFGKELMNIALSEIQNLYGRVDVRIGAQAYLKKFYEDLGFKDLNEPYMEDGIPHLIMLGKT